MVHEHCSKVFFGHSAVHPLDHARIGMAHCHADEVRRHAVQPEPGAEGPPEVVGAHRGDAGTLAGFGGQQQLDFAQGISQRALVVALRGHGAAWPDGAAPVPVVFDHFPSAAIAVRILVASILIFPISFFMCLPLGVQAIEDKPRGAIPWAWGMNGLFTTIGGLGSALLSMFWGLRITLLIAFGIYVLAEGAFLRLKILPARPDGATTPPSVFPKSWRSWVPQK